MAKRCRRVLVRQTVCVHPSVPKCSGRSFRSTVRRSSCLGFGFGVPGSQSFVDHSQFIKSCTPTVHPGPATIAVATRGKLKPRVGLVRAWATLRLGSETRILPVSSILFKRRKHLSQAERSGRSGFLTSVYHSVQCRSSRSGVETFQSDQLSECVDAPSATASSY